MPVLMVRNTLPGPLVLSSDPKGTVFVEWQGANDPNGGDVQPCPEEFASLPAFHKQVLRGILVVENPEDNPEIAAAIERQNKAWHDRQQNQHQSAQESIQAERNDDFVTQQCVGPNPRGQGQCDAEVTVQERKKNEQAPLCPTHEDLRPQYVPTEGEKIVDGKSSKTWTRVTMGSRQRQE